MELHLRKYQEDLEDLLEPVSVSLHAQNRELVSVHFVGATNSYFDQYVHPSHEAVYGLGWLKSEFRILKDLQSRTYAPYDFICNLNERQILKELERQYGFVPF